VAQQICKLVWIALGLSPIWSIATWVQARELPIKQSSVGEIGIDALRLHEPPYNLTGKKIAIGQVEIGRPGKFGVDKEVSKNPAISLMQVFFRNVPAKGSNGVDGHAQNVASVMVSSAKGAPGVAPGARLYASAAGRPKKSGQQEECLAAQHIATRNGGDVRAINLSFGESLQQDPRPNPVLDGNALLTQCLDWSARVHDVMYVVAGNQGKGGIPIPTDNFNAVNVAFTTRVKGIFAKVDFANLGDTAPSLMTRFAGTETNLGPRRAIGLVAPGNNVPIVNLDGSLGTSSGTSFAAPHVTATVALLQEYGDRQLQTSCKPNCRLPWSLDSRRHEVMKAVLLNSADKLKDNGDGQNLGMSRTIIDKSNRDWLASDAYRDPKIPLDLQMGTGQLNAFRAYQQFSPGQMSSAAPVAPIGWDYHTVGAGQSQENPTDAVNPPAFQDYVLEKPLQAGSFVSATLTWDRIVELEDTNKNGEFDVGESFRDRGLNNLNLYLMRVEDNDPSQAIWSSVSEVDSTEHIFRRIQQTGRYKLRVQFQQQANAATQPYALAWWTKPVR
jgi:hypothetical protein